MLALSSFVDKVDVAENNVDGGLGTTALPRSRGGDVPEAFRAMWASPKGRSGGAATTTAGRRTSAQVAPHEVTRGALPPRCGGTRAGNPLPESARRGHIAFGQSLATLEQLFISFACFAGNELPGSVFVVEKASDKVSQATSSLGDASAETLVRQGFLDIAPFLLDPTGARPPERATCPAPGARARPSAS